MTIEAKLIGSPNSGLPTEFSLTGAPANEKQAAAVIVHDNKFFGFGKKEGGRVKLSYSRNSIEIKPGQTEQVDILFPEGKLTLSASYKVKGT